MLIQMVPAEGVEPTHPHGYQILSLARLPIPPHRPPNLTSTCSHSACAECRGTYSKQTNQRKRPIRRTAKPAGEINISFQTGGLAAMPALGSSLFQQNPFDLLRQRLIVHGELGVEASVAFP